MKYDIVPIKTKYRGMGRLLTTNDFTSAKAKKNYMKLLENYFEYISFTELENDKRMFDKILEYYKILREHDVLCEIIVYDTSPIVNVFDKPIEFLGVDIVRDMSESLLENNAEKLQSALLNENLLCSRVTDVVNITEMCDHGDVKWEPCWVYKVQC